MPHSKAYPRRHIIQYMAKDMTNPDQDREIEFTDGQPATKDQPDDEEHEDKNED